MRLLQHTSSQDSYVKMEGPDHGTLAGRLIRPRCRQHDAIL